VLPEIHSTIKESQEKIPNTNTCQKDSTTLILESLFPPKAKLSVKDNQHKIAGIEKPKQQKMKHERQDIKVISEPKATNYKMTNSISKITPKNSHQSIVKNSFKAQPILIREIQQIAQIIPKPITKPVQQRKITAKKEDRSTVKKNNLFKQKSTNDQSLRQQKTDNYIENTMKFYKQNKDIDINPYTSGNNQSNISIASSRKNKPSHLSIDLPNSQRDNVRQTFINLSTNLHSKNPSKISYNSEKHPSTTLTKKILKRQTTQPKNLFKKPTISPPHLIYKRQCVFSKEVSEAPSKFDLTRKKSCK